ncbi:recombinase family protein [Pseudoalteromonas sp. T1lg48]|uniref:recombinase family protein n=1 Tax=Pseudoalteromonas sp. T1lg48 TaxID=2077100 RepID=UPI000CF65FEE|nr:recombinase family protein [Pseudoalteromonas sp. T1lg48]
MPSRTFIYARVSTSELTVENQLEAIQRAGYSVPANRVITEVVSGGVNAMEREAFKAMVTHKLEKGDTVVVQRLDRLGRDNIDVQQVVELFVSKGIRLVSLDLPVRDLSSSEGKLMLQLFSAFAEFEKNRIKERTIDGLKRAKSEGKKLGRPSNESLRGEVVQMRKSMSIAGVAKELGISVSTVKRLQKP